MKIDHIHFYVEDAKKWRDWFVHHLGFQAVVNYAIGSIEPSFAKSVLIPKVEESGYCWGDEVFHTCTEVVKSGAVCFVLSSPLLSTSPVAEFLRQHPPGVADVAFDVEDVEAALALAFTHGAKILQPIQQQQVGEEYFKWGKIAAWGGLTHTLIEKSFVSFLEQTTWENSITAIDHIVLNVAAGDLENAVAWYENILDFQPQQTFKIETDRSALHSQVMISRHGGVQLPINEPASPNSQIQEFIEVNCGPGIQHIALQTANIVKAIAQFRACGLPLLSVPKSYYEKLVTRLGLPISLVELEAIAYEQILVDWKQDIPKGPQDTIPLLLQIFTQPIFGKPTFFFEFIERRFQAKGFGEGNFRALFEAIETEQIKRGTLH